LLSPKLHIPLYALPPWGLFGGDGVNRGLMVGLGAFFVVHVVLRLVFINLGNLSGEIAW
jgi:hypothetical protein